MSSNIYPIDTLGNPLKVGDFVRLRLSEPYVLTQVIEVRAAGGLSDAAGNMLLNGEITFRALMPVQFAPDRNVIVDAFAVRVPEPEGGSKLVTN